MNQKFYIKINPVYQKLKQAETDSICIYLHAPVGTGKTSAVEYYFRNRSEECQWLSGADGYLPEQPDFSTALGQGKKVLVIDDISWITEQPSKNYVLSAIHQTELFVVLIGRNRMPAWMMEEYTTGHLMQADERDLWMNAGHVEKLMKLHGCDPDKETAAQIVKDAEGYPLGIAAIVMRMASEGAYTKAVLEDTRLDVYRYYDYAFWNRWKEDERQLLMCVADFDCFDTDLAAMASADANVPELLEYAHAVGDFLQRDREGNYRLRPILKEYLLWKQELLWTQKEKNEIHKRASLYYELQKDIPAALRESGKCGDEERIIALLIKNAEQHPGTGHYYETKEYYKKLSEECIGKYPVLMAGMSMLYSLTLQPEESEYWYQKLCALERECVADSKRRKDARSRIAYLDIALPHRGAVKVATILKSVAKLCQSRSISIPEFSVTNNLPSVMNGGKDFCEWSRIDRELAKVMKAPIEIVLGAYGVGLVNIALAESAFEKADMDDYEIMTLLDEGYKQAEFKGKTEICFAGLGVLIKLHVQRRQLGLAEQLLSDFEKKVIREKSDQLLPNIHAMQVWFSLLRGDHAAIKQWVSQTPNEFTNFYILDRYQYLMKMRCYLALEKYDSAWNLSECLNFYFTRYERHYLWMENTLLRAILSYKQGRKQWKELFEAAYKTAESYHFPWVIAQEGMAVLPLLGEWAAAYPELDPKEDMETMEITGDTEDGPEKTKKPRKRGRPKKSETGWKPSEEFYWLVKKKTDAQACYYPNYLKREMVLAEPLTETEKRMLQLHSSGYGTKEILELLQITERTFWFHNSNIYKKLGVKNKSEAILAAKQIGIVN